MSIFDTSRVVSVFAGPGCGKTTFITRTIDALLAEGVKPSEIMYILFNRKPAIAFRKQYALPESEMTWWGTHHSICMKLMKLKMANILDLAAWGKDHGFNLSTEAELKERGLDEYGWDAVFSSLSRKIYTDDQNLTKEEARLLNELQKTEDEERKYTHVRYLQKALRLNLFPVGVKYVFLDEAQDNGKLQLDWLQRIVDTRDDVKGIMLAGDDKQAINGFKGGDPMLFLNFPVDQKIDLVKTYRLPPPILTFANRIVKPVKFRSVLTTETIKADGGKVIHLNEFRDTVYNIFGALKQGKNVLVLVRNRCFLPFVAHTLIESYIPIEADWHIRIKRTIATLLQIRKDDGITEETMANIVHTKARTGQLKLNAYWDGTIIHKMISGDVLDDAVLFDAYEKLRLGKIISLDDAVSVGFTPDFVADVRAWRIPKNKWNLDFDSLQLFRGAVNAFGWDYPMVRIDTIHAVKGEEADMVVLVDNITGKTDKGELDDEDAERRVWFVASTRSKETLIITSLTSSPLRTKVL